jgi:hypothetical protein
MTNPPYMTQPFDQAQAALRILKDLDLRHRKTRASAISPTPSSDAIRHVAEWMFQEGHLDGIIDAVAPKSWRSR